MPKHVLYSLYVTLILPYLSYCNIVWATKETTQIKKWLILQKKAIRVTTHSRWNSHTSLLFRSKSILKLNDLNTLLVGCYMYSAMHTVLPAAFHDWFIKNSSIHTYSTRRCNNIHHITCGTQVKQFSLKVYGYKIWNDIPYHIRDWNSSLSFKRQFKLLLLGTYV